MSAPETQTGEKRNGTKFSSASIIGIRNPEDKQLHPATLYDFLAAQTEVGIPTPHQQQSQYLYPGLQNGKNNRDRAWNNTIATRANLAEQLSKKGGVRVVEQIDEEGNSQGHILEMITPKTSPARPGIRTTEHVVETTEDDEEDGVTRTREKNGNVIIFTTPLYDGLGSYKFVPEYSVQLKIRDKGKTTTPLTMRSDELELFKTLMEFSTPLTPAELERFMVKPYPTIFDAQNGLTDVLNSLNTKLRAWRIAITQGEDGTIIFCPSHQAREIIMNAVDPREVDMEAQQLLGPRQRRRKASHGGARL